MRDVLTAIPQALAQENRWAVAPMWTFGHRMGFADALIYPFWVEMIQARIPNDWQPQQGRPSLKEIKWEDGYWGLINSWKTNLPQIAAVDSFRGQVDDGLVWLPNEATARMWSAFVSHRPQAAIMWPIAEFGPFMGPRSLDNRLTVVDSSEPIPVLAAGPMGNEMQVHWFINGVAVVPVWIDPENPYPCNITGYARRRAQFIHGIHRRWRDGTLPPILFGRTSHRINTSLQF